MGSDFPIFSRSVDEANETMSKSLHCAIFVLWQASELPVSQRRSMIETVKDLISVKESCAEEGS